MIIVMFQIIDGRLTMNDCFASAVADIYETRKDRSMNDILPRILKISEEAGEAAGAILSITENSYKKLTPDDLREELVDCWIVVTDALLTPISGEEELSQEQINLNINDIIKRKMEKWKRNKRD